MARDQAQSQTAGKLTEENTHEALPRGFPFNTLSQQHVVVVQSVFTDAKQSWWLLLQHSHALIPIKRLQWTKGQ